MKQRIITGIVAVALLVPVLIFSYTPVFAVAVTFFAIMGTWEMLHCVGTDKKFAIAVPAYAFSLGVFLTARFLENDAIVAGIYTGAAFLFFVCIAVYAVFSKGKITVDEFFASFSGVFYVGTTFGALILLRESFFGEYLYLIAMFLPWVSYIFAYFVGVFFGRHKLIPEVSPKKTIEGSLGGMAFSGIGAVVFAIIMANIKNHPLELWMYIIVFAAGMVVSALSQVGDLVASHIKRRYGIKDYGFMFPGHGGVLDRLDSVIFTTPVVLIISYILQYLSVRGM